MNIKTIAMTAIALAAGFAFADKDAATIQAEYAALTNAADRLAYKKSLDAQAWSALADAMISVAATNEAAAKKMEPNPVVGMGDGWNYPATASVADGYDTTFSAAGIGAPPTFYKRLPKSAEVWIASTNEFSAGWVASHPVTLSFIRRNKNGFPSTYNGCTFGEYLNFIAEEGADFTPTNRISAHSLFNMGLSALKEKAVAASARIVKLELRRQGKSFVVQPDGKNPVQDAVDALFAALDAPKMEGLGAWVAAWCPSHTWVEPTWADAGAVAQFKEAVYLGDKPFTSIVKFRLCAYLGVTEYNKFVREYNGE